MTLAVGSDEVLAQRAGAGDERAFGELARRYRGLIVYVTRRAPSGLSRDDLRQEALIGLFEACRAHDPSKGAFAQMAGACVRHRVWRAQLHARRAKHRVLTDALGLDHCGGPAGDGEQLTIAERLPARDGVDPALVVEWRERLAELAAAVRALTPGYREALLGEGSVTARRRWHVRRRLEELLDQGATVAPARVDGRLYSDRQIERALALVAEGRCLREAGEAVGAAQTTVLRWLARAA